MARRSRDLAGLAALGALGYMAMRGDKQAPAPVEDRSRYVDRAGDAVTSSLATGEPDYSAELAEYRRRVSPAQGVSAAAMSADDTGDFLSRRLRINPETGEAYSMDNLSPMSAPVRSAASSRPVRSDVSFSTEAAYRDPSRKKDVLSPTRAGAGAGRSTGRGGATAAEMAEYQRQQELERMRGRGYGTTYKKGGSVKAKPKKMASGGMTSASKRADGIATKGKTKCKMY